MLFLLGIKLFFEPFHVKLCPIFLRQIILKVRNLLGSFQKGLSIIQSCCVNIRIQSLLYMIRYVYAMYLCFGRIT
ncbi:hypothetical protein AM586_10385 [Massilia sp. WG5]|nr:hypothetical protein AM586_10385 [Massilia sp. WG5]